LANAETTLHKSAGKSRLTIFNNCILSFSLFLSACLQTGDRKYLSSKPMR